MDKEQCKDKYIYTHSENGSNLKRTSHVSHHPLRTFSFWGPPAITKLIMSPPKANPSFVHWITSLRPFRNIAPEMPLFPSCDRIFASIQQVPPANKPIAISPTLKTIASLDSTFTTMFPFFAHLCSKIPSKGFHPHHSTRTCLVRVLEELHMAKSMFKNKQIGHFSFSGLVQHTVQHSLP